MFAWQQCLIGVFKELWIFHLKFSFDTNVAFMKISINNISDKLCSESSRNFFFLTNSKNFTTLLLIHVKIEYGGSRISGADLLRLQ